VEILKNYLEKSGNCILLKLWEPCYVDNILVTHRWGRNGIVDCWIWQLSVCCTMASMAVLCSSLSPSPAS